MQLLPIDTVLPELVDAITAHRSVVLQAPPGAGKTTRVPLALLDALPGSIVMLEPRRIAASSAARWMARSLGEDVGGTVGYTIRFDRKVSKRTRIEVVTEGVLTRRLQGDPSLDGVSLVIFDEFHERSIHADLALALCIDVQQHLRDDLKLLVMSATLDGASVARLLGDAPVIRSEGRSFTVEERYLAGDASRPLVQRMTSAIEQVARETDGDVLAFLPGAGEIRGCAAQLETARLGRPGTVTVHPLYGDLPFDEQERAIMLGPTRRIVLATNIAETSITIDGVRVVVDGGMTRRVQFDPATGMDRLMTVRVSRAAAEQRKGRAGRTAPGICYRLYGRHDFEALVPFAPPEIVTADLAPLLLDLALWGVKDILTLAWLDPPPAASVASARALLQMLRALDGDGAVTEAGRRMAHLPVHPRMARLLLDAESQGCTMLGCDLAALLTERDVFRRALGDADGGGSDIDERLDALRSFRERRTVPERTDMGALRSVDRVSTQLRRLFKDGRDQCSGDRVPGLLIAAYPDRVGCQREHGSERYLLANGRGAKLSPRSAARGSRYLVAVSVDGGTSVEGTIHQAVPIDEDRLRSVCAGTITTVRQAVWDEREGRVAASIVERIGAVVLSSRTVAAGGDDAAQALVGAVRGRISRLLDMNDGVRQLQGRVRIVAASYPEERWPDLSDDRLDATLDDWLAPHLAGVRNVQALKALDMGDILRSMLSWEKLRLLEERVPTHLAVPSGHRVALDYASGDLPVLAVKLQEMFGLADTPAVCGGRVSVVLHLLSPARRPVQVTQDLRGFWNGSYQDVRKEMKGRYPKHPWPEDPWNAVPTRGVKRK